jgi:hypothetical protein
MRICQAEGKELHVIDLATDEGAASELARALVSEGSDELVDARAKAELRARVAELDEIEADAEAAGDGPAATRAREERAAIAEHLSGALGFQAKAGG